MITDQFVYELYISNTKEHTAARAGVLHLSLFAYFFSSLRSNKKCDTFSYTTKVIQQAGVTLIKLGAIPL